MKVLMAEWVGGIKNLPAWFKGGEELEVSWEQIKELYDTGNNVMISHSTFADPGNVLWVDNKRFTQR